MANPDRAKWGRVATHLLAFSAGALLVAIVGSFVLSGRETAATVVLSNETTEPLTNLRIHNQVTGGTLVVDRLAPGEQIPVLVYVRGEGGYVLTARLPGVGVVEAERYVETGYTITEHITADKIEPEHVFY